MIRWEKGGKQNVNAVASCVSCGVKDEYEKTKQKPKKKMSIITIISLICMMGVAVYYGIPQTTIKSVAAENKETGEWNQYACAYKGEIFYASKNVIYKRGKDSSKPILIYKIQNMFCAEGDTSNIHFLSISNGRIFVAYPVGDGDEYSEVIVSMDLNGKNIKQHLKTEDETIWVVDMMYIEGKNLYYTMRTMDGYTGYYKISLSGGKPELLWSMDEIWKDGESEDWLRYENAQYLYYVSENNIIQVDKTKKFRKVKIGQIPEDSYSGQIFVINKTIYLIETSDDTPVLERVNGRKVEYIASLYGELYNVTSNYIYYINEEDYYPDSPSEKYLSRCDYKGNKEKIYIDKEYDREIVSWDILEDDTISFIAGTNGYGTQEMKLEK